MFNMLRKKILLSFALTTLFLSHLAIPGSKSSSPADAAQAARAKSSASAWLTAAQTGAAKRDGAANKAASYASAAASSSSSSAAAAASSVAKNAAARTVLSLDAVAKLSQSERAKLNQDDYCFGLRCKPKNAATTALAKKSGFCLRLAFDGENNPLALNHYHKLLDSEEMHDDFLAGNIALRLPLLYVKADKEIELAKKLITTNSLTKVFWQPLPNKLYTLHLSIDPKLGTHRVKPELTEEEMG